jgi:hypothetical protein
MQLHETLPRNLPQPGIKRTIPASQVIWQSSHGFSQRLLNHIRRIKPHPQPGVHTYRNHPPEPIAIASKKPFHGLAIASLRPAQQFVALRIVKRHGWEPSITIPAELRRISREFF